MEDTQEQRRVSHASSRLLLVDDDPALLEALSGTLQNRLGHYTLHTSQTGMKALECVKASPYDAIITDWNMPGMSGLQLLEAVKQVRPQTPVVLISGHADQTLIAQALQAGATDFITKPIDRDIFLHSIRRALNLSRLQLLLARQEALIRRTRDQYLRVVEKISASNEQWLVSSEALFIQEPQGVSSSHFRDMVAQQEEDERQLRAHHSRANRYLVGLDAFSERVAQAHLDTSVLLHAAEDEMRRYAVLRLQRR